MAKDVENVDLDLGEEKPSKKKLLIIVALVALLLIGGGVAAYFILYSGVPTDQAATLEEGADAQQADTAEVENGPALYVEMAPVFVVNLPGQPSLLQVGINVRVTSDQMVEFIKYNDPMLRHHLLNLLQRQDAKLLQERTTKETLQAELLSEINRIAKELSAPGKVDALYFSSFVMQ
jgi:flagellar FliL protein